MFNDSKFVNVCQLNCNGLSDHCITAIDNFVSQEKIQILALQETGYHSVDKPEFVGKSTFLNYVSHGVGLAIDQSLLPQLVPELACTSLEVIWVLCRIDNQQVLLGSSYSPPSEKLLKPVLDQVDKALDYCKKFNISSMLCMGDFNARSHIWGDHTANPKGKELLNFLTKDDNYFLSSPGTRTFISMNPQGSSVIDLCIAAGAVTSKLGIPRVNEAVELFSGAPVRGHFPVLNTIQVGRLKKTETRRLDFFNCDWEKWHDNLELRIRVHKEEWNEMTTRELWESLLTSLKDTNDACIPIKKVSSHSKPYWSSLLTTSSSKLQTCKKAYQARATPLNKANFELSKQEFAELIVKEKNAWIHRRLEGLNVAESAEFWSKYKFVFGSPRDNNIGNLMDGADLLSGDAEKEALFHRTFFGGKHLENVQFDDEHYSDICSNLQSKLDDEQDNSEFEEKLNGKIDTIDVKMAIAKQKSNGKATDTYGIHPVMLKNIGTHGKELLATLFNKVLDSGEWVWNDSLTSLIKKINK